MPIFGAFATWLASLVASFAGFFAAYLSKKVSLGLAAVAASAVFFLGFAAVVTGMLTGLSVALPGWASAGAIWIPENVSVCMSAVMTARVARWVYGFQMQNLRQVVGSW